MIKRGDKGNPVRRVIHRGSRRRTGRFTSLKMKKTIPWESTIERDFIRLLEYDREVLAYFAQPLWVSFYLDGKRHKACPDFRVVYADGTEVIWEVKPEDKSSDPEFRRRFETVRKILAREGFECCCITDTEIRSGKRLANIVALFRYLHWEVSGKDKLLLQKTFSKHERLTIGDLLSGTHAPAFPKAIIFAAIAQGILEMDINGDLNNGTPLNLATFSPFQTRRLV